eukprot:6246121-Pyramimonas_sp.AAC.2
MRMFLPSWLREATPFSAQSLSIACHWPALPYSLRFSMPPYLLSASTSRFRFRVKYVARYASQVLSVMLILSGMPVVAAACHIFSSCSADMDSKRRRTACCSGLSCTPPAASPAGGGGGGPCPGPSPAGGGAPREFRLGPLSAAMASPSRSMLIWFTL